MTIESINVKSIHTHTHHSNERKYIKKIKGCRFGFNYVLKLKIKGLKRLKLQKESTRDGNDVREAEIKRMRSKCKIRREALF